LTSGEAAQRAGFSQSKLSKIENGMLLPAEADVQALGRVYRATALRRREAVNLVRRLRDEFDSARVILRRGAYRKQREIGLIEAETRQFRDFQPTYVLGLLQTSAYARRIFSDLSPEDAGRAVDARLDRQRILRDTAKRFDLVMTEGALRWSAGPPELMTEQLDHIAALAELPNIDLGVISWTTQVDVFPGHAFHLYDERLAIVGTLSATATIRDPRDIALYVALFERLRALADRGDEASRTLRRIRDEYAQLR
jgi:transcriptional regulator with XRE-family HTH domain